MSKFLEKKPIQYFIIGLIVAALGIVIISPDIGVMQEGADFAVHLMLTFLIGGLLFLVLNNRTLVIACFGATIVLCLFLKGASNSSFLFPSSNKEPKLTVAHIDVSSAGNHDLFMKSILKLNPDVISFQEVDLGWEDILDYYLNSVYPHKNKNVRIDAYGMAVYSKMPIVNTDTIFIEDFPTLSTTVFLDGQRSVTLLSTYMLPPLDNTLKDEYQRYLGGLAQEIRKSTTPILNLGKFHLTYWRNYLRSFRDEASLENSRRDARAAGMSRSYDHIFFTSQLECTNFEEVLDTDSNHQGIIGTYQFKANKGKNKSPITSKINRY